jgi:hypothetical protein
MRAFLKSYFIDISDITLIFLWYTKVFFGIKKDIHTTTGHPFILAGKKSGQSGQ